MDGRPIDLARARREAKALLGAAHAGDPEALARVRAAQPARPPRTLRLADAQLAIARELGARSWPALVRRAEAEAVAREDRGRALVQAATTGRLDRAEALLALDAGPSRAALDVALVLGDHERVTAVLAHHPGAARMPLGARGWEPLLYVAYSAFLGGERTDGLLACARALLDTGADPNAAWEHPEHGPMSALYGAAGRAHEPRLTALLLQAGAHPNDGTSLHGAAGAEDPECLRLLLDAGATPYRTMALAHAVRRGRLQTARLLLGRGPQPWGERENALQWAVHADASPETIRLLVEHGADLEASFDGTGRTPYGLAVRSGRRDLAELLASLGAQRRVEPLDELIGACVAGERALARRMASEQPDLAWLLRTAEADGLVAAASEGRRATVEILLDLGVPVDTRGPSGDTALHAAGRRGDAGLVALLLERGAESGPEPDPAEPRHDEPPFGELGWAAEQAYLRLLASSALAERRPCGDGIAVITGIDSNAENGVVCSRLDGDVDATIAATFAWFAERRAPAQWLLGDPAAPADLRARLVAAGASAERTAVVMGAELARLDLDPPADGIELLTVRDAGALEAWGRVARACVFDEEPARRVAVLASLGLDRDEPLQHRLAVRDGDVVGMASYLLDGTTVLGQHLGVLPAQRRGGVGRALVAHALRDARAAGARIAVLGPTPDTVAFYDRLGFVLRPWPRDRTFYLPLPED